ncbi:MAG: hypothetical protein JJE52_03600 [Acidimicrobiia bacterium]|nr:hypothetical protein [Acidimicrobiia bacterium]
MAGRTTPKGQADPDRFPTLRERSPLVWWMAMLMVAALVLGTIGGGLAVFLA